MPRKQIPHFRFYPRDFIEGVEGMERGEIGDYIRLLARLYEHDGALNFDIHKLRFLLDCRPCDVAKRIRKLIDLGKIFIAGDGTIHNARVDDEMCLRANWRANHPQITPSALPEKSTKTTRARYARPESESESKPYKLAPSFHARVNGNGHAPAALGALGLEGRAPSLPLAKGGAPPPDKPWPPPSNLLAKIYPNGKAHKPGNGSQPGRNSGRSRKAARPRRAAKDNAGVAKGAETKSPDAS